MGRSEPYVLGFTPILKEKVWGGRRLERYGKLLAPGRTFGESWEIADLASTAKSGGGGDAARSVIDRGPMAGETVGAALAAWGSGLVGDGAWKRIGGDPTPAFPLLVKFLDAREHLSVQTHPSPAFAAEHAWAHLKTESWLVLESESVEFADGRRAPGTVFSGIEPGVGPGAFAAAIELGTVSELLTSFEAAPGSCFTLPSGTCHALGGGVLVLEVQTPSDTTFRVYDWMREFDRTPRELHVAEATACLSFDAGGGQVAPDGVRSPVGFGAGAGLACVSNTERYAMSVASVAGGGGTVFEAGACRIVVGLRGTGRLVARGDASELAPGRTLVIPAALDGVRLESAGDAELDAAVIEVR